MNLSRLRTRNAVICLHPSESGGSLLSSIELIRVARQLGHQAELICTSAEHEAASEAAIEYLGISYAYTLILEREMAHELGRGGFDRVIASTTSLFPLVHRAALQAGLPFMVIVRGGTYGPETRLSDAEAEALAAAERVACVSVTLQRQIAADFGRSAVLLPTPLPIGSAASPRPEIGPSLIYAGHFSRRKHTHFIPVIATRLIRLGIRPKIRLFGDGPEKEKAVSALAKLPVEVESESWRPHAEVMAALGDYDFLIAPSAREGRPRIVLEAIAAGTAPVMSAIPAHVEFFASNARECTWPSQRPAQAADLITLLLRDSGARKRFWDSLAVSSYNDSQRRFAEAVDVMLSRSRYRGFSEQRSSTAAI